VPGHKPIYILTPRGLLDQASARIMAHDGAEVQKVQPPGTPPNGSLKMCFVQVADTGELIGLVCEASLTLTGRTRTPRDPAKEAREAGSRR
jgi:hypothetical protein